MSDDNWRSFSDIQLYVAHLPSVANLQAVFALSRFWATARLPAGYTTADKWGEIIVLTDAGTNFLNRFAIAGSFSVADQYLAIFSIFYHHDLLIDVDRTTADDALALLSKETAELRIRWPFVFGRQVYDRFNDTAPPKLIDYVPAEDVFPLLSDTPQGIYQVGQFVSGPLGLIKSKQLRHFPPRVRPGLWHCSDPGCRFLHNVHLLQPQVPVVRIEDELRQNARAVLGPPSDWGKVLSDVVEGPVGPRARSYYDIATLIAQAILFDDRTTLLERALRSDQAEFLRLLIEPIKGKATSRGSPRSVVENLSPEEQLQLLFCLTDDELVRVVDGCVFDGSITIPPNEERTSHLQPPKRYFIEAPSSLSSLGVREVVGEPLASVCSLIWDACSKSSALSELDWRVKGMTGVPTQLALLRYLRITPPGEAVKQLILASEPITSYIVDELQYTGSVNSPDVVPQLLWKFGFEVARFSETYKRLRARLQIFTETILQIEKIRSEDDREKIRSVGVNVFVSLEQILEELIAYTVWLFASDHFLDTLFVFDLDEAKRAVPRAIGETVTAGDEILTWKITSENVLSTLYVYLERTATWLKALLSADRESDLRPKNELPHYVDVHEKVFPFYHKQFWADVEPSGLGSFVDDFQRLARKLFQSNASAIRNGLDHQRPHDAFPEIDAMLAFSTRFKEALDHADIQSYLPKEYWVSRVNVDEFNRTEYHFRDYESRSAVIYKPSFAVGMPLLDLSAPLLIAPGNLLSHVGATLTFGIRAKSNYATYWKGYPRRRIIPDASADTTASPGEESSAS